MSLESHGRYCSAFGSDISLGVIMGLLRGLTCYSLGSTHPKYPNILLTRTTAAQLSISLDVVDHGFGLRGDAPHLTLMPSLALFARVQSTGFRLSSS